MNISEFVEKNESFALIIGNLGEFSLRSIRQAYFEYYNVPIVYHDKIEEGYLIPAINEEYENCRYVKAIAMTFCKINKIPHFYLIKDKSILTITNSGRVKDSSVFSIENLSKHIKAELGEIEYNPVSRATSFMNAVAGESFHKLVHQCVEENIDMYWAAFSGECEDYIHTPNKTDKNENHRFLY